MMSDLYKSLTLSIRGNDRNANNASEITAGSLYF